VVFLGLLVLAGCSRDSGPEVAIDETTSLSRPTTTTTESLGAAGSAAVTAYFEAFATLDAEKVRAMLANSSPGSLAHSYARHQLAVATANLEAGTPDEPQRMQRAGDTIRLCNADSEGSIDETTCTAFSEFAVDRASGKLTRFAVDGGTLKGRIALGDGVTQPVDGGHVALISVYRSVSSDSLFVAIDVTAGETSLSVCPVSSRMVDRDGRQAVATDGIYGTTEIAAGATTTIVLIFPSRDPVGRISFSTCGSDVEVPIPPVVA
jgi:hypothetical protein